MFHQKDHRIKRRVFNGYGDTQPQGVGSKVNQLDLVPQEALDIRLYKVQFH